MPHPAVCVDAPPVLVVPPAFSPPVAVPPVLTPPVAVPPAGLPPVLTIHGDADPSVPHVQSVRLHKALTDAGVPNELMTIPGGKHGYYCCNPAQRVQAYAKIREFLVRHGVLVARADSEAAGRARP